MSQAIRLIGVPLELGADFDGIQKGPAAVRKAGVTFELKRLGKAVCDKGDITIPGNVRSQRHDEKLKHVDIIRLVNEMICTEVETALREKHFPLVIGGDHSIAIGTLAGVRRHTSNIGVIWIDAHGDLNTHRTTPSGHIHGMPLAAALGFGDSRLTSIGGIRPKVKPEHVVLIGVRSLDPGEQSFIKKHGIRVFTADDVRRLGMDKVMEQAATIAGTGTQGIHLSFDLDVLDPSIAPGVSTPVTGGLYWGEAEFFMQCIRQSGKLISAEFVEVNPDQDRHDETAAIAVKLIGKLFG